MNDRDLTPDEWATLIGLLEGPQTAPDWLIAAVKRGADEDPEIASLRAALAAEREAHEKTKRESGIVGRGLDALLAREKEWIAERDAAIARAETAERERDAAASHAERVDRERCEMGAALDAYRRGLTTGTLAKSEDDNICSYTAEHEKRAWALGWEDGWAHSIIRRAFVHAERERDEARARLAALVEIEREGWERERELRALRAVRERILASDEYAPTECHSEPEERVQYAWWVCSSCGEQHESDREKIEHRADCLWRMALAAAKGGG